VNRKELVADQDPRREARAIGETGTRTRKPICIRAVNAKPDDAIDRDTNSRHRITTSHDDIDLCPRREIKKAAMLSVSFAIRIAHRTACPTMIEKARSVEVGAPSKAS
jgi:hypothetical protein